MNLKNLQIKYHQDLSELYTSAEITELFAIFTEEILNWNKITLHLNQEKTISENQEKEFHSLSDEIPLPAEQFSHLLAFALHFLSFWHSFS